MADDGPKGYVLRGKGLPAEGKRYACPACPTRACVCFSAAWEASKRHSLLTGHSVVLETVDGLKLAETRPTGSGGGHTYLPAPRTRAASAPVEEDETDAEEADRPEEPEHESLEELAEQELEDES